MPDITGTGGNDVLFFQGTVGQLTVTLVNPYSGASIYIDEEKNINNSTYNGLGGVDTLFLTSIGDAFFSVDSIGVQTILNIERIIAGDGGDVIVMASDTVVLGNMLIDGGRADDILWGNAGNDSINGSDGNDIIDGGPGNDTLLGQNDNDKLNGGDGNDTVNGGLGVDLVAGDAGNDSLVFVTDMTFENIYWAYNIGSPGIMGSGEWKHVGGLSGSLDVFDGGSGFDTLTLTAGDDAFFLENSFHAHHPDATSVRLVGVEQINAGFGNDVVDLTHNLYSYGDVIINGGDGDDYLWSSSGNDTINGDNGHDNLWGDVGNDTLRGGAGNDILRGGPGNNSGALVTTVQSHTFNNTVVFPNLAERVDIMDLVPSGTNALGIAAGDLSVDYNTTAEISFVQTVAGFRNTLGFYNIAQDGTIMHTEIAFTDVKAYAPGSTATINLPGAPDTDFGFFIIANGANKNNNYTGLDLENGTLNFIYNYGKADERAAKITDDGKKISLVFSDGVNESVIVGSKNHIYHTTTRDGSQMLNPDGKSHVVSGLIHNGDDTVLRIGFEDLPNLGDADYNDVVFDLKVASKTTQTLVVNDADILYGDAGNDALYGGVGNDVLNGGAGADTLEGGHGSDRFVFDVLDGFVDTVKDFAAGEGGDILDIGDVLQGYDALTDTLSDFVQLVNSGNNVEIRINADGDAGGVFTAMAIIEGGVGGASLNDLVSNGNLVTV